MDECVLETASPITQFTTGAYSAARILETSLDGGNEESFGRNMEMGYTSYIIIVSDYLYSYKHVSNSIGKKSHI